MLFTAILGFLPLVGFYADMLKLTTGCSNVDILHVTFGILAWQHALLPFMISLLTNFCKLHGTLNFPSILKIVLNELL